MKSRTTILLEEGLLRKLKKEAFEKNTSVTNIIEGLVKDYFNKSVKTDRLLWIKEKITSLKDDELKNIIITPSLETATSINSLTVNLFDVKSCIENDNIDDIKKILTFVVLAFVRKMLKLIQADLLYVEEKSINPFSITISIKNKHVNANNKKLIINSLLNLSESFSNLSYFEQDDSLKIVIKNT